MTGWLLSAIKGEQLAPHVDGWLSFGVCPRCSAMVPADAKRSTGDLTWAHEQWHAETDWPIPSEVSAKVTRRGVG
jgi:hypothetical protein